MAFYMYVSISGEGKLLRFAMDPSDGSLKPLGETEAPGRPAPMAASPDRKFVYVGRRDDLEVSSFGLDAGSGDLELVGTAGLESDPCYMSTDRAGNYLLTAYYNAGHAAVHAIGDDGAVAGPPVEWVATGTGAHCFQTDPTNRYGYVPHIAAGPGPNAIFQFRFDPDTGHITPNDPPRVSPENPGRTPPLLLPPQPGHHLCIQRAGVQRNRLQPGPGHGGPQPLPDPFHPARGVRGKEQLLPDTDYPQWQVRLRPQPGPRQHRRLRGGRRRDADRPGADSF